MEVQTVEQFLVEQLNKLVPGKYTLASVLQLFKSKLRYPCNHLKGGGRSRGLTAASKDYNLSIFTFPDGVTEIKCLYNCGLKIRSDQKELISAYNELYDLPSTNTKASSEWFSKRGDPGPTPTYSDAYRRRVRESNDAFLNALNFGLESGRIEPGGLILGGVFPHPDPKEAPESEVERGINAVYARIKKLKAIATVVLQNNSIPKPKKIRKRKTQSRKRGK